VKICWSESVVAVEENPNPSETSGLGYGSCPIITTFVSNGKKYLVNSQTSSDGPTNKYLKNN